MIKPQIISTKCYSLRDVLQYIADKYDENADDLFIMIIDNNGLEECSADFIIVSFEQDGVGDLPVYDLLRKEFGEKAKYIIGSNCDE